MIMPLLVIQEMIKDGFQARDVSKDSHALVSRSWGTTPGTMAGLRGQQTTTPHPGPLNGNTTQCERLQETRKGR